MQLSRPKDAGASTLVRGLYVGNLCTLRREKKRLSLAGNGVHFPDKLKYLFPLASHSITRLAPAFGRIALIRAFSNC